MAVTEADVRHVAELARLELDADRVALLVQELNGILAHMEVLAAVDAAKYEGLESGQGIASPLRSDEGPPIPMATEREDFAPAMRDGFFVVPRLATHEDGGADRAP